MTPRLSVVIPSHRRADHLRRCLAILRRYAPSDTEILVIDDGSPDGLITRTAARGGIRAIPTGGAGFCVAANRGIAASGAAFVQLLNDDTAVCPGWAQAALGPFADARVGAVAPLLVTPDERTIDAAGDDWDAGGFTRKRGHGEPAAGEWLVPRDVPAACAAAAFYRRDALHRVGAFAAPFGAYFEDVDLSLRLGRAGYRVRYEPASRVRHWGGQSYGGHRANPGLLARQSRNEERLFWRHLPTGLSGARALARHTLVLAAKAARRAGEGTLRPFLIGRRAAWAEVPALLRWRADFWASVGA